MSFNLGNHNFIQKKKLGEQYFFFNVKPENKKSTIYQITTTNLHRTDGINNLINFLYHCLYQERKIFLAIYQLQNFDILIKFQFSKH